MPLEGLFTDTRKTSPSTDRKRMLCEISGVLGNPFPSAAQTSGHPHFPIIADNTVDDAISSFYADRKSHVLAITATQGIGKTNLLNAYENALQRELGDKGFFVIRYVADPDRFFDRLIISVLEYLGENHLRKSIEALSLKANLEIDNILDNVRNAEVGTMLRNLLKGKRSGTSEEDYYYLGYQWLLGLPIRKAHRELLGVNFRLDTVETKTRALRDMVYFSYSVGTLQGVFLLLDELEKGDTSSSSKTELLRYLQALRALIDALPQYLFLMLALTPDALNRYREMQPALKGRLANEVRLSPLRSESEALAIYECYLNHAQNEAASVAKENKWRIGKNILISTDTAVATYRQLLASKTVEGVRQRDYLNQLHRKANEKIEVIVQ
ncbi:MAG: hypothetical protein ACRYFS_18665 [Janthinobacterium lividum]